jgi:peptidoglycan glycosyltransferase
MLSLLGQDLGDTGDLGDRLEDAVARAMSDRDGAAVVLDVETGQVLAAYRMDVAARRVTTPGSAIKPFTLLALVEAGVVDRETAVFCPMRVRIGNRVLDCSHPALSEPLDAVTALAYSCNHFFSSLAERLGVDVLYRTFSALGLGGLTGRWPSEIGGSVHAPASLEDHRLMGIGEDGVQVTPLGLAEAYRTLALDLGETATARPALRLVLEGLRSAVERGTGQRAASDRVDVAGKTGTSGGHAWFAGFAPAGHPEIVTVVFLEAGTGGADAAPIAGEILDAYAAEGVPR